MVLHTPSPTVTLLTRQSHRLSTGGKYHPAIDFGPFCRLLWPAMLHRKQTTPGLARGCHACPQTAGLLLGAPSVVGHDREAYSEGAYAV